MFRRRVRSNQPKRAHCVLLRNNHLFRSVAQLHHVKCTTALCLVHDRTVVSPFPPVFIKVSIMELNKISIMDVADETLLQIFSYGILDRQDLCGLALLCRRFSTLAAVRLYNTINYLSYKSWRGPHFALLSRTCYEHPERAVLVHHLSLSWIHEDCDGRSYIMDLLAHVPMLRSLSLIARRDQELEDSLIFQLRTAQIQQTSLAEALWSSCAV